MKELIDNPLYWKSKDYDAHSLLHNGCDGGVWLCLGEPQKFYKCEKCKRRFNQYGESENAPRQGKCS